MDGLANLIASALRDVESIRYAALASSCIIFYDYLITMDGELELIWNAHWSLGKVLFLVNRYYALSAAIVNNYGLFSPHLTNSFCMHFFRWQGYTGLIAAMIAQMILQMRLYALYKLNKKILLLMGGCFTITSAASATIMSRTLSRITVQSHVLPGVPFCVPFGIPGHFYTFWIPLLLFEALMCGLALYRGFRTLRTEGSLFQSGRQLVRILIRDSIFYFLAMFATYFTNLLVWVFARYTLLEIPVGFSVAISCVMANRLVLNVREVNRDLSLSQDPTSVKQAFTTSSFVHGTHSSQGIPGQEQDYLTAIQMTELRSFRAPRTYRPAMTI